MSTDYNFYGTLPPKHADEIKYNKRYKFLQVIEHDGINVYRGACYVKENTYVEKGVDVLIWLDLYQFSIYKYD